MAAAVVANGRADVFRNLFDIAAEVLDALLGKVFAFERRVDVCYISAMMFVMMDLHRSGVDVRL
jgi:hypothetical protein